MSVSSCYRVWTWYFFFFFVVVFPPNTTVVVIFTQRLCSWEKKKKGKKDRKRYKTQYYVYHTTCYAGVEEKNHFKPWSPAQLVRPVSGATRNYRGILRSPRDGDGVLPTANRPYCSLSASCFISLTTLIVPADR